MALTIISFACLLSAVFAYRPFTRSETFGDPFKFNRVIGGKNAEFGEFPHQISLQWGHPPFVAYSHICGGSIINEKWILTAGHCVVSLPQSGHLIVRAGKFFIKPRELSEQNSLVAQVFVHPQYRGEVSPYDIALLKLLTPLKFNKYVNVINLPKANVIPEGNAILSGWGSISRTSIPFLPDVLQKVVLPILDLETCRNAMMELNESGEVHDTHICTGPLTGGYSSCSGDSGGPLIQKYENGTSEVIGIVSWGLVPCGRPGAPAVFVRVSAFVDWIQTIMAANYLQ